MRSLLLTSLALGALALAAVPADAACSSRGRWCDYPAWASNAFESRSGRVNLKATYGNDYGDDRSERRYYDRSQAQNNKGSRRRR